MQPTTFDKFMQRFGATCVVGLIGAVALVVVDMISDDFSVPALAMNDAGVRGAIFSAIIGVSGLFLTVMLAVLAVVTSLDDEKPVVKVMKEEMKNYDELIERLLGPVFIVLAIAIASIVCLLVPTPAAVTVAGKEVIPDRGWMTILPSLTLAFSLGLFVQTALVARLLGKVLLFKHRKPSKSDTPDASRARLESYREQATATQPQAAGVIGLGDRDTSGVAA